MRKSGRNKLNYHVLENVSNYVSFVLATDATLVLKEKIKIKNCYNSSDKVVSPALLCLFWSWRYTTRSWLAGRNLHWDALCKIDKPTISLVRSNKLNHCNSEFFRAYASAVIIEIQFFSRHPYQLISLYYRQKLINEISKRIYTLDTWKSMKIFN